MFDMGMQKEGYKSSEEYTADLFRMLAAFLEVGMRKSQAGGENGEAPDGSTDMPADPGVSRDEESELVHILTYIQTREAKSSPADKIPFLAFCLQNQVTPFEKFCFLLGIAAAEERQYREIFRTLQEGQQWYAAKGLALFLYQNAEKITEQEFDDLQKQKGVWKICFQKPEEHGGVRFWQEDPILLKQEYIYLIYGKPWVPDQARAIGTIWEYKNPLENLLFYGEKKEQIVRLEESRKLENPEPEVDSRRRERLILSRRTVVLLGKNGSGRLLLLKHAMKELQKNLLILDGKKLEQNMEEKEEETLREIQSTRMIYGAAVCIVVQQEEQTEELARAVEGLVLPGQTLYLISQAPLHFSSAYVPEQMEVAISQPRLQEKIDFWKFFLEKYPHSPHLDVNMLGNRYVLNGGEISQITKAAYLDAQSKGQKEIQEEHIINAVKKHNQNGTDLYAVLMKTVYQWEDLVVESGVETRLRHICNQIRYRSVVGEDWGFYEKRPYGRGISALFYGPPGTGKTMAAQVMAKELGMDLYRVDISRMMSKYIGETQKHVTQLFEWAKNINALLFFDEADALFSRRTEVTDANDRHANSEVAHLLQQMEEYDGIVILATNLRENLDDAFKRRIKFMVDFKMPDPEIRRKLWHHMLPDQAPVEEDLALDFFAEQFELSGSEIKEVVMQGAFLAAAEGSSIGNRHLQEALGLCYEKYGRRLGKEEFAELPVYIPENREKSVKST